MLFKKNSVKTTVHCESHFSLPSLPCTRLVRSDWLNNAVLFSYWLIFVELCSSPQEAIQCTSSSTLSSLGRFDTPEEGLHSFRRCSHMSVFLKSGYIRSVFGYTLWVCIKALRLIYLILYIDEMRWKFSFQNTLIDKIRHTACFMPAFTFCFGGQYSLFLLLPPTYSPLLVLNNRKPFYFFLVFRIFAYIIPSHTREFYSNANLMQGDN